MGLRSSACRHAARWRSISVVDVRALGVAPSAIQVNVATLKSNGAMELDRYTGGTSSMLDELPQFSLS